MQLRCLKHSASRSHSRIEKWRDIAPDELVDLPFLLQVYIGKTRFYSPTIASSSRQLHQLTDIGSFIGLKAAQPEICARQDCASLHPSFFGSGFTLRLCHTHDKIALVFPMLLLR
jgi:hypothetical protein